MERTGSRVLATALFPGVWGLAGCTPVPAGLSNGEKYILVYSIAALAVLVWLLWRVKYGKKRKQAPRQNSRRPQAESNGRPKAGRPEWLVPDPEPTPEPPPARTRTAPTKKAASAPPKKEKPSGREPLPSFGNAWWDIPEGTRIFIDTCVMMEAGHDRVVAAWFEHLRKYAAKQGWTIVILNAVIRELDGLKNSADEERAQASRAATNLLGDLQRALGGRFSITGAQRTPADDEFEREMRSGDLLCTRDNNLALRINGVQGLKALGLADFPRIPRTMRRA